MPITDLSNEFYKRVEKMTEEEMLLFQKQLKVLPRIEPEDEKS